MHSLTMYRGRFAPWSAIEAMNFLWPDRTVRRLELPLNQGYPYDMLSQRDCKAPTHTQVGQSERQRERERRIGWGTFLKRACSCAYCIYIYTDTCLYIYTVYTRKLGCSTGGQCLRSLSWRANGTSCCPLHGAPWRRQCSHLEVPSVASLQVSRRPWKDKSHHIAIVQFARLRPILYLNQSWSRVPSARLGESSSAQCERFRGAAEGRT